MNSCDIKPIKLKLGLRSANLIQEEFPLASKYLSKLSNNEWILETNVCSYDGVGRFVMGLLDDIEIVDSPEFFHYIQNLIKNFQNKLSLS
jgi:hypothetical protein